MDMDKDKGKFNYLLVGGLRNTTYVVASLALAEINSEHPYDYLNAPKGEVSERIIEYLLKRRRSVELEDIKRRLSITNLKDAGACDKLSFDKDFQLLFLRTIADDNFEFKKTRGIQPFAHEWANNLERIAQLMGLGGG